MVLFQHDFRGRQIFADFAFFLPRQSHQCVNIIADDSRLRRHGRHQAQLFQFGLSLCACILRHLRGPNFLIDLFEIGPIFTLAQFFLNGLYLLIEIVVALTFLHLPLDSSPDAFLDLKYVKFSLEQPQQMLQAFWHIKNFQDFLLLLEFQRQMRGDGIRQTSRFVDAA
jgi:hypothetical protein